MQAVSAASIPKEIAELFRVQDGEDPASIHGRGYCFDSLHGIAESTAMLREMIEEDETLPNCFLNLVPFLSTDVKSTVGVFAEDSTYLPGCVVELHHEAGSVICWASDMEEFLYLLSSGAAEAQGFGRIYPAPAKKVTNIEALPGWATEE